jgi:hypothetical protein
MASGVGIYIASGVWRLACASVHANQHAISVVGGWNRTVEPCKAVCLDVGMYMICLRRSGQMYRYIHTYTNPGSVPLHCIIGVMQEYNV